MASITARWADENIPKLLPQPTSGTPRKRLGSGEVGERLGIDRYAALKLLKSGAIPGAFPIGNRWYCLSESLERHLAGGSAAVGDLADRLDRLELAVNLLLAIGRAQAEATQAALEGRRGMP